MKILKKIISNCNECDYAQGPFDPKNDWFSCCWDTYDYYCAQTQKSFGHDGYPKEIPDWCPLENL